MVATNQLSPRHHPTSLFRKYTNHDVAVATAADAAAAASTAAATTTAAAVASAVGPAVGASDAASDAASALVSGCMVGVDLSPKMIDISREKGGYDELMVDDGESA
mmetsp:Transcript_43732/g.119544  ORF Transcript_43732/g.119544 Transcript_43732/m.119544 type:complete len:106 (+) Transcript_43732:1366-1683(+)